MLDYNGRFYKISCNTTLVCVVNHVPALENNTTNHILQTTLDKQNIVLDYPVILTLLYDFS